MRFLAFLIGSITALVLQDLKPIDTSDATADYNAQVLRNAMDKANKENATQVVIPKGKYYFNGPIQHRGLRNLDIVVEGEMIFKANIDNYPFDKIYPDLWTFEDCHYINMYGNGIIDGSGYDWWLQSFLFLVNKSKLKSDNRPRLVHFQQSTNLMFKGLTFKNSPMFHLNLFDVVNVTCLDLVVDVDIFRQKELGDSWGEKLLRGVPLFPLNTDGIDPSGLNIYIKNFTYTGYDDAVAVKPANIFHSMANCTNNVVIEDAVVNWGTGMAIGSVLARRFRNCIDGVIIRNVKFNNPFKAIYVKTNPGDPEGGISVIANILYENIVIDKSIWWPIYIGPQQQRQPDGSGPGCFLYPLQPCPTEPGVTISNITLKNVDVKNTIWPYAGLVRCNAANPCKGFVFDNVRVRGGLSNLAGYRCENIQGLSKGTSPKVCF
jgi:polygalacturonase